MDGRRQRPAILWSMFLLDIEILNALGIVPNRNEQRGQRDTFGHQRANYRLAYSLIDGPQTI